MLGYYNLMEPVIEDNLSKVWKDMDCCKCDDCHDDIMALSLNMVRPKYVSTREGEILSRITEYSNEKSVEIIAILMKAIDVVSNNPRHNIKKTII